MEMFGVSQSLNNHSWLQTCSKMETSPSERRLAGLITGITALVCFSVDAGVAYVQQRTQPLHGCFAILYKTMVVNECINLLIYAFFVAPVLFTNSSELGRSLFAQYVGHIFLIIWGVVIFLMLAISINRYIAIAYPITYRKWCSKRMAIYIIVSAYAMALLNTAMYFHEACDIYISTNWLGLVFSENYCGPYLWWHCTISCSFGICVLFSFNMATFVAIKRQHQFNRQHTRSINDNLSKSPSVSVTRVQTDLTDVSSYLINGVGTKHRYGVYTGPTDELAEVDNNNNTWQDEMRTCTNEDGSECIVLSSCQITRQVDVTSKRRIRQSRNSRYSFDFLRSTYNNASDRRAQKMKRCEIRFFVQAALNGMCFEGMIVSFHLFGLLCHAPWGYLITGSWPLLFCHGTNGFIMLLVHNKLRRTILRRVKELYQRIW